MKSLRFTGLAAALALGSGNVAIIAAHAADGEPSVRETMEFIQTKLEENADVRARVSAISAKTGAARIIPAGRRISNIQIFRCTLQYDYYAGWVTATGDNRQHQQYFRSAVDFSKATNIAILSAAEYLRRDPSLGNFRIADGAASPSIYWVEIRQGEQSDVFSVQDQPTADRIAKAAAHAAQLCGGLKSEAF